MVAANKYKKHSHEQKSGASLPSHRLAWAVYEREAFIFATRWKRGWHEAGIRRVTGVFEPGTTSKPTQHPPPAGGTLFFKEGKGQQSDFCSSLTKNTQRKDFNHEYKPKRTES
jgi:hypothetical protein